jgi:hypothetical protein
MVPIILSMTTIPSRASVIDETIGSLLQQTHRFDELRIYITHGTIHPRLAGAPRVIILPCIDRGPITKLSAAVDPGVHDSAIIITVDDDINYKRTWLETLMAAFECYPNDACGFSGWDVDWFLATGNFKHAGQTCDVLEGFAGVAYRKSWFGPEILDPPDYARDVDDVWIGAYLHRKGITRRVVGSFMGTVMPNTGLHNAPDFIAKNRFAVRALFGT